MFVDEATITIKAGNGGSGAATFRREKYVPKGGPDGGNGGDGGDLYLVGVADLGALKRFRYKKHFEADSGKRGGSRKKTGARGEDLMLPVPVGTLVKDLETLEEVEILENGQKELLAKGGVGGRGNWEFKSPSNTTPREFEKGEEGVKRKLYLELQLIADVGLVGLPNAGKSSLLNALTRAKAVVANYPFTTLEPNLGAASGLLLADIPGLIEGASKGKGLGHKFLRHVKRTKMLAHLVSVESEDLERDYQTIRSELNDFDKELSVKPELVVLTKVDLVDDEKAKKMVRVLKKFGREVIYCSIDNLSQLKKLQSKLSRMCFEVGK